MISPNNLYECENSIKKRFFEGFSFRSTIGNAKNPISEKPTAVLVVHPKPALYSHSLWNALNNIKPEHILLTKIQTVFQLEILPGNRISHVDLEIFQNQSYHCRNDQKGNFLGKQINESGNMGHLNSDWKDWKKYLKDNAEVTKTWNQSRSNKTNT